MGLRQLQNVFAVGLLLPLVFATGTSAHALEQAGTSTPVAPPGRDLPSPQNPRLKNFFLIGNSGSFQAQAGREAQTQGSANRFAAFFDASKLNIVDRILVGPDIRDYLIQGAWPATLALIKPGDVVLLQFGPQLPTRAAGASGLVLPGIGDDLRDINATSGVPGQVVHTYGWYLRQYVVDVIARGATPILCTPLSPPAPATGGSASSTPDYDAWVRQIAVEQRVGLVDLSVISSAASTTPGNGERVKDRDASVLAGIKGLPHDPLAGYFSPSAASIPPFAPPAPPPAAAP